MKPALRVLEKVEAQARLSLNLEEFELIKRD